MANILHKTKTFDALDTKKKLIAKLRKVSQDIGSLTSYTIEVDNNLQRIRRPAPGVRRNAAGRAVDARGGFIQEPVAEIEQGADTLIKQLAQIIKKIDTDFEIKYNTAGVKDLITQCDNGARICKALQSEIVQQDTLLNKL